MYVGLILGFILTSLTSIVFYDSDAGTGGPVWGSTGRPIFVRSLNPIPTGEGRLSPPITTGTPNGFHLPASLYESTFWRNFADAT
jgi:hypothetical protein